MFKHTFLQKYRVQFLHLGLNRKISVCRRVLVEKVFDLHPCIIILKDGNFKKVLFIMLNLVIQTRISPLLLVLFLQSMSQSKL